MKNPVMKFMQWEGTGYAGVQERVVGGVPGV